MAWKKGGRPTTRKGWPKRRGPPLARVRRTWETAFNQSVCDALVFQLFGEGCNTLFKIVLADNTLLQSKFSDRARIVRILGDLWFQLDTGISGAGSGGEMYLRLAASSYQMFYGLRVGEQDHNDQTLSPDVFGFDEDLSESRWLKTWQRYSNVYDRFVVHLPGSTGPVIRNTATQCSNTFTDGISDNIFTDGSGTINITTECTEPECLACEQPAINEYTLDVSPNPTYHQHIDVKKRIPLRENQELYLMGNLGTPGVAQFPGEFFGIIVGNLRVLVEF